MPQLQPQLKKEEAALGIDDFQLEMNVPKPVAEIKADQVEVSTEKVDAQGRVGMSRARCCIPAHGCGTRTASAGMCR